MREIPYDILIDLAEGRIDPAEAAVWRARVAKDAGASVELEAIERIVRLMRADDMVDAPEHVITRAVRLMRRPEEAHGTGVLRKLLAVVRSDSWHLPRLAAGVRAVQAWPRALLLSAGDHEIDLQITPQGDQWQIQGQVLGPEGPAKVILIGAAEPIERPLNELGEFILPSVATGVYAITVITGETEIVLNNIEVGLSPSRI